MIYSNYISLTFLSFGTDCFSSLRNKILNNLQFVSVDSTYTFLCFASLLAPICQI